MKHLIRTLLICIALLGCATTAEKLARLDTRTGPVRTTEIATLKTPGFASELVTLATRVRVTQTFLIIKPDNPVASVILFAGGDGSLNLSQRSGKLDIRGLNNNFLVRSRSVFAKYGFVVVVVDVASDQRASGLIGLRTSAQHVKDIEAVIAYLKKEIALPVWLIGTSRGTESATFVAIHSREAIHGLVLTSSITVSNDRGIAVDTMALDKIHVPTLVVAHEHDQCWVTPPYVEAITKRLVNSTRVAGKYFSGGEAPLSEPCRALSAHGYLGIEEEVIAAIVDFIKNKP